MRSTIDLAHFLAHPRERAETALAKNGAIARRSTSGRLAQLG